MVRFIDLFRIVGFYKYFQIQKAGHATEKVFSEIVNQDLIILE